MKLTLPAGPFQAYLFDCNGTIVDSMRLHYIAWNKAFAEWQCELTEDLFYAWGGKPMSEMIALLNLQRGLNMPVEEVFTRKESFYLENVSQLQAVPEVLEHILLSHGKVRFAVVSGSTREEVIESLEALNLLDRFETIVCTGDYHQPKPDPEPFLVAAARLGVAPQNCLVFEDTAVGIKAATAAGMAWVKILQPWERNG